MAVTFAQARQRVQTRVAARWTAELGTLVVLPTGYENATHWRVVVGAREALVDGNDDFRLMDQPAMLVSKQTGEIQELPVIPNFDRLDAMTPTEG